jgi:hypothetical protein
MLLIKHQAEEQEDEQLPAAKLEQDDLLEFRYCSGVNLNKFYAKSISLRVILPVAFAKPTTTPTASSIDTFLLGNGSLVLTSKNMPTASSSPGEDEFITFRISGTCLFVLSLVCSACWSKIKPLPQRLSRF